MAAINELQRRLPLCRIEITAESTVDLNLPRVTKQSCEMMRSNRPAMGFFNKELVDEMAKMDVENKERVSLTEL